MKKITKLFVCVIVLTCIVLMSNDITHAEEIDTKNTQQDNDITQPPDENEYITYNLLTGEESTKILPSHTGTRALATMAVEAQIKDSTQYDEIINDEEKISTRGIFATDLRGMVVDVTKAPASGVVFIECKWKNGDLSRGTGAIFAEEYIVTAAHIVYDKDLGGLPEDIDIYVGSTHTQLKLGASKGISTVIPAMYTYHKSAEYDMAIIKAEDNLYNMSGFMFGFANIPKETIETTQLQVNSYPNDKISFTQYKETSSKRIDSVGSGWIFHKFATVPGTSGAPMFTTSDNHIIGIVNQETAANNVAARIEQKKFDWMYDVRNNGFADE